MFTGNERKGYNSHLLGRGHHSYTLTNEIPVIVRNLPQLGKGHQGYRGLNISIIIVTRARNFVLVQALKDVKITGNKTTGKEMPTLSTRYGKINIIIKFFVCEN